MAPVQQIEPRDSRLNLRLTPEEYRRLASALRIKYGTLCQPAKGAKAVLRAFTAQVLGEVDPQ